MYIYIIMCTYNYIYIYICVYKRMYQAIMDPPILDSFI